MGLPSDFFVAEPKDALAYEALLVAEEPLPPERFRRVEHKYLSGLEVGLLWAILQGQQWDVEQHGLEFVAVNPETESILERLPTKLVALLAAVTDKEIPDAAAEWGDAETVIQDAKHLVPVIEDLRELARHALSVERAMWLYASNG